MIRSKQASALRNVLEALNAHANSNRAHEKHHSLNSSPVHGFGVLGDQRVQDYRRPDQQDIEGQKDDDEKRSEHDQARLLPEQARLRLNSRQQKRYARLSRIRLDGSRVTRRRRTATFERLTFRREAILRGCGAIFRSLAGLR